MMGVEFIRGLVDQPRSVTLTLTLTLTALTLTPTPTLTRPNHPNPR